MSDTTGLRAAAERIIAGRVVQDLGNGVKIRQTYEPDVVLVASAYLAEHPADDGELASKEWMLSVGFRERSYGGEVYLRQLELIEFEDDGHWWELLNTFDTEYRTRGDIRRLCRALGVPMKEGA